jgi:hypothetical protein
MFVKQISVFLENKQGRLAGFTKVLADSNIDIFHITVAETEDYGIVRCVTKDNARAVDALKKADFSVSVTDLIGVEIGDKPGTLHEVLALLTEHGAAVEYLYSFSRNEGKSAAILLKIDDPQPVPELLKQHNIRLLTDLNG